jgi:ADP-heptose:LPS heptosyltransferase
MSTSSKAAEHPVLILRIGSLGDTVVALPCLHRIAERYAQSRRILVTNLPVSAKAAPAQSIVGASGLIDDVLAYPVGLRSLDGLRDLARRIRALRPQALVYLMPKRSLGGLLRDVAYFRVACGVPTIVGAPWAADLRRNRELPGGALESECSRLARTLHALGPIDIEDRATWDLHLSADEIERAQAACRPLADAPYLAINMGGKVAINDWGFERWRQLLASLRAALPEHGLLIVGAEDDRERGAAAAALWGAPAVNASGAMSPRVSAAAMRGAELFVGHDSGPLHLAAAVGVRCVGLFGENNPPGLWHPIGTGHAPIHRMAGVAAITVDEVRAAVLTRIRARA